MSKKILLGVCGSISIYKVCDLIRKLKKEKFFLKVILSTGAEKFISPLIFSALTEEKVFTNQDFFIHQGRALHIELANYPDLILIAPATASFLAKFSTGQADELLLATLLATRAPVYIFPAMNTNMWHHPATQENVKRLKSYGYFVYEPSEGPLLCETSGKGRLPEVEEIFEVVKAHFKEKDFKGKKVLITGGPTREPIDSVRFITNASSGKMAFYLAKEAYYRGAEVYLVWGKEDFNYTLPDLAFLQIPFPKIHFVKTTKEMFETCAKIFKDCDIAIFAGAPCDFRSKKVFKKKIKKEELQTIKLEFELTEDIAQNLSLSKNKQITVGFALEEEKDLIKNALLKKEKKALDLIVANPVSTMGKEFSNFSIITSSEIKEFKNISKKELAKIIFDLIKTLN
jgi:phosphopantothenoylcysteine decarboxylase/phosphopantothenate--cysteine ligase